MKQRGNIWRRVFRTRAGWVVVTGMGSVAGLLLHNKLRLVAEIPRAVYAEPESEPESADSPDDQTTRDQATHGQPAGGEARTDGSVEEALVVSEDDAGI
ncbi:MAG: hypothetical protein AAF356_04620 [Planctomycetota bacterium]